MSRISLITINLFGFPENLIVVISDRCSSSWFGPHRVKKRMGKNGGGFVKHQSERGREKRKNYKKA